MGRRSVHSDATCIVLGRALLSFALFFVDLESKACSLSLNFQESPTRHFAAQVGDKMAKRAGPWTVTDGENIQPGMVIVELQVLGRRELAIINGDIQAGHIRVRLILGRSEMPDGTREFQEAISYEQMSRREYNASPVGEMLEEARGIDRLALIHLAENISPNTLLRNPMLVDINYFHPIENPFNADARHSDVYRFLFEKMKLRPKAVDLTRYLQDTNPRETARTGG